LIEDLVAANRILVDQGVLDGWGHVSGSLACRSPNICGQRNAFYSLDAIAKQPARIRDIPPEKR
jgi:hypothetical protein